MSHTQPALPRLAFDPTLRHPHSFLRPTTNAAANQTAADTSSSVKPLIFGVKRQRSRDDISMDEGSPPPLTAVRGAELVGAKRIMAKRIRLGSGKLAIGRLLASLEKKQLVDVLLWFVQRHPPLLHDLLLPLPKPTVQIAQSSLQNLERKLLDSFPYSRDGPARNDYAYLRIRPILFELIDTLFEFADHFASPDEHPSALFAYAALAMDTLDRLPRWDNQEREAERARFFSRLNEYWLQAVRIAAHKVSEGRIFGAEMVGEWARLIAARNENGRLGEVMEAFRKELGWIVGVH